MSDDKNRKSPLAAVFLANQGLFANVFRRYRLSQIDIDDFTQETIKRALEAENRTEIREPRRFLVGIAKNVARAELERRAKLTASLLDDFDADSYVSDEPSVDEVVDGRRRMKVFGAAVAGLPPQCQKVFVMKYVYGATHREIADKLDIAVSTVEKHVALGLKRCRAVMQSDETGGETGAAGPGVVPIDGRQR